ncbi:MAG: YggU family protein [Methanospirillaceae archaeon]|nr:YggU family protein [Methanospirillaceae archaeon]
MNYDITDISSAISESKDGIIITIDLTPASSIDLFPAGYNPWRQAVTGKTKAPAVSGKANKAIISLIAERLQISETTVSLISGQTSSKKRIFIDGITKEDLVKRIFSLLE